MHKVLDPIAQRMRTTSVLETKEGSRIVGAGAKADLSPAQRAILQPGEVPSKLRGAHAEITVLEHAAENNLTPSLLEVSRKICADCAARIEQLGGKLTRPTKAEW